MADGEGVGGFYERVLGLRALERGEGRVRLGVDGRVLIELVEEAGAPSVPPRSTGLFHLAVLVPDRAELALTVRRADEAGWPLAGASDHLVSEAIYLSDPEGNGIEVYRDRPREEWPYRGGELQMATEPLDLRGVMGEPSGNGGEGGAKLPAGTHMGHVHLKVADLAQTESFYAGVLGLDVTVRGYPGALFFSAGGYHHHVGANTWHSAGAPPPPPGSRGLRSFEILVPGDDELARIATRIADADLAAERAGNTLTLPDPSGNRVRLTALDNRSQ